jgi:hypothetical protein
MRTFNRGQVRDIRKSADIEAVAAANISAACRFAGGSDNLFTDNLRNRIKFGFSLHISFACRAHRCILRNR